MVAKESAWVLVASIFALSLTTGALWVSGETEHLSTPLPSLGCGHSGTTSTAVIPESSNCSLMKLLQKFHLHLLQPSSRIERWTLSYTKAGTVPVLFFFQRPKGNITRKYKNLHFLSSLQKQKEKISTLWLINLKNVITKLRQKIKGLGLWCLTSNWLKPDSKGKYAGDFNACAFGSIPSTESRAQVWELLDHDYLYFNEIRMHFSMKGEYPFHTQ